MKRPTHIFVVRRTGLVALSLLLLTLTATRAQYIPSPRVPQTSEPGLADPKELPKTPPTEMLLPSRPRPFATAPANVPRTAGVDPGGPASSSDPPTPAVSIRVRAPASVAIGAKEVVYTLLVENVSQAGAHHVQVTNPVPRFARFLKADPEPKDAAVPILRWELGTLPPGVSREIKLTLQPTGDGDITNIARVQFEHGQQVTTVVNRPSLTLKRIAPQYAHESDSIPVKLIVENTGRIDVRNVVVTDVVEEGLQHTAADKTGALRREWPIESLAPGQKRELEYAILATKQGAFTSSATARGEYLSEVSPSTWTVTIGKALLDVKVVGPEKPVYVSQFARYQIVVKNQGTIPMDNVAVAFSLPKGVKVKQASYGAEQFSTRVQWVVPKFEPNGMRTFSLQVQAEEQGTVPINVQVLGRGKSAQDFVKTEFVGASALRLRVRKSSDPVQVGDKVTYTVTVQNTGTAEARDLNVKISLPAVQMKVDTAALGLTSMPHEQGVFVWGPLNVRAGETKAVTVPAEAASAGKVRFHAEMTAPELSSGAVTWEEETTIVDKSK